MKEKTNTWTKSCKESAKRESEFFKMVELAAIHGRQEDKERSMLQDSKKKERVKTKLLRLSKKCNKIERKRMQEPLKLNGKGAVYSREYMHS